jgi:hypothetical protein
VNITPHLAVFQCTGDRLDVVEGFIEPAKLIAMCTRRERGERRVRRVRGEREREERGDKGEEREFNILIFSGQIFSYALF